MGGGSGTEGGLLKQEGATIVHTKCRMMDVSMFEHGRWTVNDPMKNVLFTELMFRICSDMSPPVPLSLEALGSAFSSLHRDSQWNGLARQFSPWQFSEGRSEFHKCVHHVAQLLSDKQAQLTKQSSRPKVVNKSGAEQSFTTPVYQEIGFASTA